MMNSEKPGSRLEIRPLHFSDGPAIASLSEQNGMGRLDLQAWQSVWEAYPLAADFREIPIGWVLENAEGRVLGYLGNMHQMYEYHGVFLKAASSGSWMVDAAHRGTALPLVIAFYKQKGIDLYLNGSANQLTIKVMAAFKIPRIPLPDYNTPCFWALRPRAFALAVMRRKSIPGASVLSWMAGSAIGIWDLSRQSGRGKQSVAVNQCETFGLGFDDIWPRLSSATPRLRAVRNAAILQWKFGVDLRAGNAIILVAGPINQPSGYAVLIRRDPSELGMEMFDIADIQAVGDDPEVFKSLILAGIEAAHERGADALKLSTGTPAKRRPAEALRPYSYQLPYWQLYYKAAPSVTVDLSQSDSWDFSRFDTY